MVRSVILAAGASSRMGRCKAGLPLERPGDTFIARIVGTCVVAGIGDIVVVSGADPEGVADGLGRATAQVRIVHNADWASGQLSSLLAGLNAPGEEDVEAAIVALVDAPLFSEATVRALIERWRDTRAPVVRPIRGSEHGHPVLFDRRLFDELRRADPARGAKPVVHAHLEEIAHVPVDDPGAFIDFDTPEEYARWQAARAVQSSKCKVQSD